MTQDYITRLLTPMSQTHSLNLRSGENGTLYVPFSRIMLYSGAFSSQLHGYVEIGNSESLNAFKNLCLVLMLKLKYCINKNK